MSKGFCIFVRDQIMSKERIILSVINDIVGDQRIHRIASTLQSADFEVTVIGRKLPDSFALPKRSYQTHRMRLFFKKGKFFYLEYNFRLFFLLLFRKVDILNANDLDTLFANYLVASLRRKKLVYDSHEYFTEVPELIHRPQTQKIWLALEKWIFPKLRHVYTVNESIAEIYSEKYKAEVKAIRNLPFRRERLGEGMKKRLIYQGALNVSRGIELMIDTMAFLPDIELWIIGKGDVEDALHLRAQPLIEQGAKITFKGFIAPENLPNLTNQAGIGLSLEEDIGLSYHYASPNKVYDYLQAGLPVILADLPEMRKLVEKYEPGELLLAEERNPQVLAERIKEILGTAKYEKYQKNAYFAAQELNWEAEKEKLISIYKST